jgi:hypothetical protein
VTGSISRKLYRRVLLLYPERFRHEFRDEMLSIFDECSAAQGPWHVLADVLLSAAKQQSRNFSTARPRDGYLYSDLGSSPKLARILTIAVFVVCLIAGVLRHGGESQNRNSWTMGRSEVRFWFPTGIAVVGRNSNAPYSWRILRTERSCCK